MYYLQGEVMLRFVQNKDEQRKILQACHVNATAGHMGSEHYLQDQGEIYVAWDGEELVCCVLV